MIIIHVHGIYYKGHVDKDMGRGRILVGFISKGHGGRGWVKSSHKIYINVANYPKGQFMETQFPWASMV